MMMLSRGPQLRTLLSCVVLALLMSSCGPPGRRGVISDPSASAGRAEEVEALLAADDFVGARDLARSILATSAGASGEDRVLYSGSRGAWRAGDTRSAERWLAQLTEQHPQSPLLAAAWADRASIAEEKSRWFAAAAALTELHGVSSDAAQRSSVEGRLREILDTRLRPAELKRLADQYPAAVIGSYAHYLVARRGVEGNASTQIVGDQLVAFLSRYPDSRYVPEVRQMLALWRSDRGYEPPAGSGVNANFAVGILCPLSGENAALGQAMYDGALLALEEHNRATGDELRLISLDTKGDGVQAVTAARELIQDEGVLALVGGLLSHTTIAVATLCQERDIAIVSPTATQETIGDLGDQVFQTNLTQVSETRMIAQVAVNQLLRKRFAILYPDDEQGTQAAELFAAEVEALGARIVSMEPLDRGNSDYRSVLRRVLVTGPEAIFAPVTPSEMRLIAPQMTFVGLETQILGPSSWNNSLLGREAADSMDRAIFPSDIARIPEPERERFYELWSRRFRGQSSNPFGLKTYFAVKRILDGVGEGRHTREDLKLHLEEVFGATSGGSYGIEKLRMLQDGKFVPFPVALFPVQLQQPSIGIEKVSAPELEGEGDER